jgi:ABC-2 type transport system permease protein
MVPLILAHSREAGVSPYFIQNVLNNRSFAIVAYSMVAPILIAVILFRYMQQSHSTAVCHGWPMTRRDLFLGNMISGWIILMIPLLVRMIIVWIYREPTFIYGSTGEDIYTVKRIIDMGVFSLVMNTAVYAVSMVVTMITGSSLFQAVFSFGFIFLFPGLGAIINEYFVSFLFGYERYLSQVHIFNYLTPIPQIFTSVNPDNLMALKYLMASFVLMGFAFWLYNIRPLENAGDPIAIGFAKPIFKLGAAFVGMSLVGFYFKSFVDGNEMLEIMGFGLGIVLALILAEMIVQKTFWFVRNTKSYLFFTLVTLAFLLILKVDVFGYETKVPQIDHIESVIVQDAVYYWGNSDDEVYQRFKDQHRITDLETISQVMNYHQEIISKQSQIEERDSNNRQTVEINYQLTNGKTIVRGYDVPREILYQMDSYETLFENDIYQVAYADITHIDHTEVDSIVLMPEKPMMTSFEVDSKEEIAELLELYEKDLKAETFEEHIRPMRSFVDINIVFDKNVQEDRFHYNDSVEIMEHYLNVMRWLEEKGYAEDIRIKPEEMAYASVREIKEEYLEKEKMIAQAVGEIPETTKDLLVVTRLEDLQELLSFSYQYGDVFHEQRAYEVSFVFKNHESITRVIYTEEVPNMIQYHFES